GRFGASKNDDRVDHAQRGPIDLGIDSINAQRVPQGLKWWAVYQTAKRTRPRGGANNNELGRGVKHAVRRQVYEAVVADKPHPDRRNTSLHVDCGERHTLGAEIDIRKRNYVRAGEE